MAKKSGQITAYCMKTKEKNVPMVDAVIHIKSGRYMAMGHDGSKAKNKMVTVMSKEKAEAAIADGVATKGEGWAKAKKK